MLIIFLQVSCGEVDCHIKTKKLNADFDEDLYVKMRSLTYKEKQEAANRR